MCTLNWCNINCTTPLKNMWNYTLCVLCALCGSKKRKEEDLLPQRSQSTQREEKRKKWMESVVTIKLRVD
jgi:hypothetical protein